MQFAFIHRRVAAASALAALTLAMATHAASGAPPIEITVTECAAAELDQSQVGTWVEAGCGSECVPNENCASCTKRCPGRDVCCPTMERVTEEKSCWNVKCEKVCVPAIRMPWQPGGSKLTLFSWLSRPASAYPCGGCVDGVEAGENCECDFGGHCCAPRCGTVRCVSVLESDSYEVTSCRCKWEIRGLRDCGDAAGCGSCVDSATAAEGLEEDGILPMPTP